MPITSMFAALFSAISIANSCLSLTFASDILCIYERKPEHYPLLGNQLCTSVYPYKPSLYVLLAFFCAVAVVLAFHQTASDEATHTRRGRVTAIVVGQSSLQNLVFARTIAKRSS